MTAERATFSVDALATGATPWRCYAVDDKGRIATDADGALATISLPKNAPAWLLGRTRDGVIHCVTTVEALSTAPGVRAQGDSSECASQGSAPSDLHLIRLTQIAAGLEDDEALLAIQAVSLGRWHADNRFCSRCAAPMVVSDAGWSATCSGCATTEYPRTDPAVIVRVTDSQDRILLAHNTAWPDKRMSLLAGYVDAGETPGRAVVRELREEVDLEVTSIHYVGSQPWPGPRSLMLAFDAKVEGTPEPRPDSLEIDRAQFFARTELQSAISTGAVVPPGPASIAHALIADWLGAPLSVPHDLGDLFDRLATSTFRASFKLSSRDRQMIDARGMDTIRGHAREFVSARLAPAQPKKDGKQTPYRGHPVFPAQHATGTCCRSCLHKWHRIQKGEALSRSEQDYVVEVICQWIARQLAFTPLQAETDESKGPRRRREPRKDPAVPSLF